MVLKDNTKQTIIDSYDKNNNMIINLKKEKVECELAIVEINARIVVLQNKNIDLEEDVDVKWKKPKKDKS